MNIAVRYCSKTIAGNTRRIAEAIAKLEQAREFGQKMCNTN